MEKKGRVLPWKVSCVDLKRHMKVKSLEGEWCKKRVRKLGSSIGSSGRVKMFSADNPIQICRKGNIENKVNISMSRMRFVRKSLD